MRRSVTLIALALALISASGATGEVPFHEPSPYRDLDESITALNILPPGQGRHLTATQVPFALAGSHPVHNTDQIARYEGLIRASGGLSDATLGDWFTDASFGVAPGDAGRRYHPGDRPGLVVVRDLSKDVPHVYGATRADAMYGSGYVTAEDRLFVMDVLRNLGRGRLSEFLGPSPSNLAADRSVRLAADYSEEELDAMAARLEEIGGPLGTQVREDFEAYAAGINQFIAEAVVDPTKLPGIYPALQQLPREWKAADSVAIAAYIGGVFSVGGGGQLRNALFMKKLLDQGVSHADARAIMADLRFENDPESPVSTSNPFPFNTDLGAADAAKTAFPDDPQAVLSQIAALPSTIDTPFGPIPVPLASGGASNALLVTPDASATGRSLAVFGPQVGYFSPEIFMEIDVHGPGVHARGGAFPGISLYVLIGRGDNYAWSATTAIGDHNDIRAVKLCNPSGGPVAADSRFYLDGAGCREMYRRTDTFIAKPSAAGVPAIPAGTGRAVISFTTERVILADGRPAGGAITTIVQGRGKVGGEPAAFVRQRSSYMADIDSALTYVELMDPAKVNGVSDLQELFSRFNYSFNWHLIAPDGVGFYTTGKYPKLAIGVDPDLPFWGDASLDYRGFLSISEHPQDLNPASGYITNWNNKQAAGFRAADDWWGYGPVGRKSLLDDGVEAALGDGKVGMVELVQAMQDAATRDVRGAKVLPYMLDVLGAQSDARVAGAMSLLEAWSGAGAHRRDLDANGQYEHSPAIALMDAWWRPALRAAFGASLGPAFDAIPISPDNGAGPGGSAYLGGMYGQMQKGMRQVLGDPVAEPFSRGYCGAGVLAACRSDLLASLNAAIAQLEARFGPDPGSWNVDETAEKIRFSGLDLTGPGPMAWQNRPTFQQVLQF